MQIKGTSAFLRSIQLLLAVDILGILCLLHGMNISLHIASLPLYEILTKPFAVSPSLLVTIFILIYLLLLLLLLLLHSINI